jgi:hypothetical protein
MKGMDKEARQALLPDYEIFSVDFTEGTSTTQATTSTSSITST